MKHKLEERIRAAYDYMQPKGDVDALLARVAAGDGGVAEALPAVPKRAALRRMAAMAAALILVVGIGFSVYAVNFRVETTVSLDVNPSIAFETNRTARVLGVSALGSEGEALLAGLSLAGQPLDAALDTVVGELLARGYLDADNGAILLSVFGRDAGRAATVEAHLRGSTIKALANTGVNVTVQTVEADEKTQAIAAEYGVSLGKAQYVRRMAEKFSDYSIEALVGMNIKQLYRIRAGLPPEEAVVAETAITPEQAKAIALDHTAAKMSQSRYPFVRDAITNYSCTLELQQVGPVYFCYFENETHNFSVRVNATTGEIYSFARENWFMKLEGEKLRPEFERLALADAGLTSDKVEGLYYVNSAQPADEEETMTVNFYDKAKTTYYSYRFGMRSKTLLHKESRAFRSGDDVEVRHAQIWTNVQGVREPTTGAYFTREEVYAGSLAAALSDLGVEEADITLCVSEYNFCTVLDPEAGHSAVCGYVEFDYRDVHFAYTCSVFDGFRILDRRASSVICAEAVYGNDGKLSRESAASIALAANRYTAGTATLVSMTDTAVLQYPGQDAKQVTYYGNNGVYLYTVVVDLATGEVLENDRAKYSGGLGELAQPLDAARMTLSGSREVEAQALAAALADLGLGEADIVDYALCDVFFDSTGRVCGEIELDAGGKRYRYVVDVLGGFSVVEKRAIG